MFIHAGLYNDSPRSRNCMDYDCTESERLGSLYAHANEMTMEEAGGVHVRWTPRKWMNKNLTY